MLVAGALAAAGLAIVLRPSSPVGHWDSATGEDRYLAAYATVFAAMPAPAETLDAGTDYGVVRVYRFAGGGSATAPLVLLPGRASGMPVWADNFPSLLQIGDVFAIDLLGEPGLSIQGRPITSDADQAAWLPRAWRDSFTSHTAGGAPVEDVPVAEMIAAGMQHYRLRLPQPTRISEERLAALDLPVLAIIAGKSVIHDPQAAATTARRALASGEVIVFLDASHAVNGEHPNDVAAAIARFLTGYVQNPPETNWPQRE